MMELRKKEMNFNGKSTITTAKIVLLILMLAIVPATAQNDRSTLPSRATATIVDTLGAATPTTKFSIFGSAGFVISESQFAGPEFSLTAPTTITEIGGFVNNCISIIAGVPQCPSPPPLVVQIRASINGVPDPSSIIASFVLSDDGDPLQVSYESVQPNFVLAPGTYYALFAPQRADSGGQLLSSASLPFLYLPGLTKIGFLDVTTGNTSTGLVFCAVRILGISFDVCIQDDSARGTLQINSTTGEYQFTSCDSGGFTISGTGTVTTRGSTITLQHFAADRRLVAQIDKTVKGNASVQFFPQGRTFTIIDRDVTNNTCACL
jgi:hypothetical protein